MPLLNPSFIVETHALYKRISLLDRSVECVGGGAGAERRPDGARGASAGHRQGGAASPAAGGPSLAFRAQGSASTSPA